MNPPPNREEPLPHEPPQASEDDTPGLCITQMLREWDRQDDSADPALAPPTPLATRDLEEPLCLTLLLQEADKSLEGAENLRWYVRSRAGAAGEK